MTNPSPSAHHIDAAYKNAHTATLKHMQHTSRRRRSKKTVPSATSPPTNGDFILFPSDERKKPRSTKPTETKKRATNDSLNSHTRHTDLAAAAITKAINDDVKPRPRTTQRHGGFRVVDLSKERDDSDAINTRSRETKPPPAPRPPKLDSPDFTDDDDDDDDDAFWASHRRPGNP